MYTYTSTNETYEKNFPLCTWNVQKLLQNLLKLCIGIYLHSARSRSIMYVQRLSLTPFFLIIIIIYSIWKDPYGKRQPMFIEGWSFAIYFQRFFFCFLFSYVVRTHLFWMAVYTNEYSTACRYCIFTSSRVYPETRPFVIIKSELYYVFILYADYVF